MIYPYYIENAKFEHDSSLLSTINRIVYDICHEINKTAIADKIAFVFSKNQIDDFPSDIVTHIIPVPMLFDKSSESWIPAANLLWNQDNFSIIRNLNFRFGPSKLLPGFLFDALRDHRSHKGDRVTTVTFVGDKSKKGAHSGKFDIEIFTDECKSASLRIEQQSQAVPNSLTSEILEILSKHYLDELPLIDEYCQTFGVIVPIYDVRPYGYVLNTLAGCLVLNIGIKFFGENLDAPTKNQYIEKQRLVRERIVPVLNRSSELLAAELHKSAIETIHREAPKPSHGLIDHFLYALRHVQYWEAVHVFVNGDYHYSWLWTRNASEETSTWQKKLNFNEYLRTCKGATYFTPFGAPKTLVVDPSCVIFDGEALSLVADCDLGRVDDSDLTALSGVQLVFQFSGIAVIPRLPIKPNNPQCKDLHRHRAFCRELRQQQIEVLRAVLPIRHAHKNAVRNAISAIMGRNMSHNIGSHVLARYSSKVKGDLDQIETGYTDHRGDFLGYLQQRMDFIAEVSTSNRSHWVQTLSLKDALARLDYMKQQGRFKKAGVPDSFGSPILLTYITGKESLTASVKFEGGDLAFACPSGEIGLHALYVILENVIRNSARHGSPRDGKVAILVLADEKPDEDQIELTIVDPWTSLGWDGYAGVKRLAVPANSSDASESVIAAALSASFLQGSGEPNPKNWGVREMQICAHYLLARQLSELEGSGTAPVLVPCVHLDSDGSRFLSYKLRLLKPKNILVLTKQALVLGERCQGRLQRDGVVCYDQTTAQKFDASQKLRLREYDFLVFEVDDAASPRAAPLIGNFTAWGEDLNSFLCLRRVGLPRVQIEELLARDLTTALTQLHRLQAKEYTTDRPAWQAPITSLAGWDARQNPLPGNHRPPKLRVDSTHQEYLHIDTYLQEGPTVLTPFPDCVAALRETLAIGDNADLCGVAWLDHANEAKFKIDAAGMPASPFFAGAAVPQNSGQKISRWIAVEPMWSDSPHTAVLKKMKEAGLGDGSPGTYWQTHAELVCAALPRVVVLDERVQSRRFDKVRDVSLYKYWPHVGIWTPFKAADTEEENMEEGDPVRRAFITNLNTPRCDLDEPDVEQIQAFLKRPSPLKHQGKADFLVVHLTILEKLQQRMEQKCGTAVTLDSILEELTKDSLAAGAKRIVVTGRGVPSQLRYKLYDNGGDPSDLMTARFVPVSALLEYLVHSPSKLGLMRVLWSA